ncbi:hypothetical protein PZA11_007755 [Diplocarpon coronariae]|uniref:HNH nuclease domain-containing protein n=1 Tax=Diplocarpon coronariae TaxID=2795749 RepID=A0A218Z347_9HELO|nr:hypothetical protein JHW43_008665 [Diplocarpon mali]OWP01665.1 hypothetical protein B2J93_8928 [Marssonina coronariae]
MPSLSSLTTRPQASNDNNNDGADDTNDSLFSIPIPNSTVCPPPLPVGESVFRHINIYHPHYPVGDNLLLRLAAVDSPAGGLQYGYLTTVCGIIAGNRWDGWLEDQASSDSVNNSGDDNKNRRSYISMDPRAVLPPGDYFFVLEPSSADEPYPVVPNFRQWRFPHLDLPAGDWKAYSAPQSANKTFSASSMSLALELRDASCRISSWNEGTQMAHIIPSEEVEWHRANNMHIYQRELTRSLDSDLANLVLLRADLHINFDKPMFTVIPKSAKPGEEPQLVLHVVQQSSLYQHIYHNRQVPEWKDVPPQFFFARLAWTVFPWLEGFLGTGREKRVTVATELPTKTRWLGRGEFTAKFSRAAQRSRPRENKQRTNAGAGDDGEIKDDDVSRKRRRASSTAISRASDEVGAMQDHGSPPRFSSFLDLCPPLESSPSFPDQFASDETSPLPPDSYQTPGSLALRQSSTPCRPPSGLPLAAQKNPADLKAAWLRQERARSGVQQTWDEEEQWAEQMEGATMGPEEAVRLLRFFGAEFKDELGGKG